MRSAVDSKVTARQRVALVLRIYTLDNRARLRPADVDKRKAGGKTDGMSRLDPYDAAIFPRGESSVAPRWQVRAAT